MKLSKWKIELIIIALILPAIGGIWWYMDTAPARKAASEFKVLVDFANRQEVEIAIIRQAAVLQQLKLAVQKAQQANRPAEVGPPVPKEK